MAKPDVVTFPISEFKLPKLDLDTLFASQTANLAAVHEAQNVLTGAVQAIAKVQYGYVEQAVVEVLAIGGERRLAGAKAASDRETEVEKRHDEHRERQQDRDERAEQLRDEEREEARREDRAGGALIGHGQLAPSASPG